MEYEYLPIIFATAKQCGVEQLVARRAHNPEVGGSSPSPATKTEGWIFSSLFYFKVMFTVYVLYSRPFDKIYIGYSSDVKKRFLFHNKLAKKGWTIRFRPWVIAHTEVFDTKAEAMKREKQLKSAAGRRFIWEVVIPKLKSQ